jgi:hypothetical protein
MELSPNLGTLVTSPEVSECSEYFQCRGYLVWRTSGSVDNDVGKSAGSYMRYGDVLKDTHVTRRVFMMSRSASIVIESTSIVIGKFPRV